MALCMALHSFICILLKLRTHSWCLKGSDIPCLIVCTSVFLKYSWSTGSPSPQRLTSAKHTVESLLGLGIVRDNGVGFYSVLHQENSVINGPICISKLWQLSIHSDGFKASPLPGHQSPPYVFCRDRTCFATRWHLCSQIAVLWYIDDIACQVVGKARKSLNNSGSVLPPYEQFLDLIQYIIPGVLEHG